MGQNRSWQILLYKYGQIHRNIIHPVSKMEFIQSERGVLKLVFEGYIYVRQKTLANGAVSYECEHRRARGNAQGQCKAKVRIQGEMVVGRTNEHTHAPITGRSEALKVKRQIKRRAEETEETAQQIISQSVQNLSQGTYIIILA